MSTREPAVIESVMFGKEDHGILTSFIHCKLDGGGVQGFGGLAFDTKTGEAWRAQLCEFFKVSSLEELKGVRCWVLRCWASWGADIEGLENMAGARFTITSFRRRMWPETAWDPLADKAKRLRENIRHEAIRIQERVKDLELVGAGYVDWSPPSGSTEEGT